ncbi:hypothetical protein [Streptomyces lavendulocolor]|uniref:hypothetical protein n=1 Tax=Streptomyces lavendulocolor TaxID=67316 RepID=UPI0033DB034B
MSQHAAQPAADGGCGVPADAQAAVVSGQVGDCCGDRIQGTRGENVFGICGDPSGSCELRQRGGSVGHRNPRQPRDPEQSNAHYRAHPLTWDELDLTATCRGEPMRWQAKHDRDAFKEVWLLFDNEHGRFPLYPGESVWIEYAYTVGDEKWGNWFQRAVRLPTEQLEVQLAFPAALDPVVWGTETSMTAEASPLRTPPVRSDDGELRQFTWITTTPALHARYRLEWRFRARPEHDTDQGDFR